MKEKLFRIRIKDCPEVKNHPEFKKFAGMNVIAKMVATGIFMFSFAVSTGLSWPFSFNEEHSIVSSLVDILS